MKKPAPKLTVAKRVIELEKDLVGLEHEVDDNRKQLMRVDATLKATTEGAFGEIQHIKDSIFGGPDGPNRQKFRRWKDDTGIAYIDILAKEMVEVRERLDALTASAPPSVLHSNLVDDGVWIAHVKHGVVTLVQEVRTEFGVAGVVAKG